MAIKNAITNPGKLVLANVQQAIYTWISKELAGAVPLEQIIWRQQSEALPPRPCVTMKITDGPKPTGFGENITFVEGGRFNVGSQQVMTLSIQIFGNTQVARPMAYQLGIDLKASLGKVTVQERLRVAGIGIQSKGDVSNISALEETEFEERSQFEVILGVAENVVDDPGTIDTANVTANVLDETGHRVGP